MTKYKSLYFIALFSFFLSSCMQDKCSTTRTIINYTPVYKPMNEVRELVKILPPIPIEDPRKVYIYDDLLLVNDYAKGIHIFNNANPTNPIAIAYIQIPGNVDMSVKNSVLYADNFIDLISFDISNPNQISKLATVENAFPENISVHEFADKWLVDKSKGVAIEWKEEEIEIDCDNSNFGSNRILTTKNDFESTDVNNGGATTGQGGSMARFTIIDNYLYTIDDVKLNLFDISNPYGPSLSTTVNVGWGIETIFPFTRDGNTYLVIGANNGMYIYDNSNIEQPNLQSFYGHTTSCDPVVAEGDYAYVTLRSGNQCDGYTNQLDIVNISDLTNPYLLKSYSMYNPHGLGVDNGLLFICDGLEGLKVYDISQDIGNIEDVKNIEKKLIYSFKTEAYDVIPNNETLILSSKDAFYQLDYSNPKDIRILSSITKKQNVN